MNIRAFIDACLDEDERVARGTRQPSVSWQDFTMGGELRDDFNAGTVAYIPHEQDRAHIARHDPARALRQVAATRGVLKAHDDEPCAVCLDDVDGCPTYRAIASIWPDAPGYRDYWAAEV